MNSKHNPFLLFMLDRMGEVKYAKAFIELYDFHDHVDLVEQLIADSVDPELYWPSVLGVLQTATWPENHDHFQFRLYPPQRQREIAEKLVRIIREKLTPETRKQLISAASTILAPWWGCFDSFEIEVLSAITPLLVDVSLDRDRSHSVDVALHFGMQLPDFLSLAVFLGEPKTPKLLGSCHLNSPAHGSVLLRARSINLFAARHGMDARNVAHAVYLHLLAAMLHHRAGAKTPQLPSVSGDLQKIVCGDAVQSCALIAPNCSLKKSRGRFRLSVSEPHNHNHEIEHKHGEPNPIAA